MLLKEINQLAFVTDYLKDGNAEQYRENEEKYAVDFAYRMENDKEFRKEIEKNRKNEEKAQEELKERQEEFRKITECAKRMFEDEEYKKHVFLNARLDVLRLNKLRGPEYDYYAIRERYFFLSQNVDGYDEPEKINLFPAGLILGMGIITILVIADLTK